MADLTAALDALERAKTQPGPPCMMGTYLAALLERDPALHARVLGLIDDPEVHATRLAAALDADGAGMSSFTVRRHRKRSTGNGCRCPR